MEKLCYIKNLCSNMIFNNSPELTRDDDFSVMTFMFGNTYHEMAISDDEQIENIVHRLEKIIRQFDSCPICFEKRESYQTCHECSNSLCSKCFVSILNNNGIYNCPFCRTKYSFGISHPDQIKEVKKILSKEFK